MLSRDRILEKIRTLLTGFQPDDIYRTVFDENGDLIVEGSIPLETGLVRDYNQVDFQGKTVIDLGCNLGFFSLLASELGASHVTGIDQIPGLIEVCRLLARLHNRTNISFICHDMETGKDDLGQFDMVVLIDFFGKSNVRKKKIDHFLRLMDNLSKKYLLTSFRPVNRVGKDLKMEEDHCRKLYGPDYVRQGNFYLLDYVNTFLADRWQGRALSEYDGSFTKEKRLFIYTRR